VVIIECEPVQTVRAAPRYSRAIHATAELLTKQRIECAFVGTVARAIWVGGDVDRGSIDVLGLMQPQQKNQVAMMAGHRGFRIEQSEIDQSEELDLVPLNFVDAEGDVRVHVLLASNALYAKMIAAARQATLGDREIRIAAPEDFALLAGISGDDEALRAVADSPGFDRHAFNDKLVSIGLGRMVLE
jgi:hypothetical protein